ncbi:hypothetical protein RHSIM_Rhsim13G0094100 [Rhododendron simsii]|uniref:Threonylcarbamoyl-AMP synthase n=1 Tax=Rhododendron simsii TaxID=118357 RepID=A0A834G055_RHOSS|nr:hypothetical protein RHSIM_Rhsim13G0094100 [Rhododendron simsii]
MNVTVFSSVRLANLELFCNDLVAIQPGFARWLASPVAGVSTPMMKKAIPPKIIAEKYGLPVCRIHVRLYGLRVNVRPATEAHAEEAVEALKDGKVIAVPTDTLYGFACDACSMDAVNRTYEIKGRKHTSPFAICVGDVSDIKQFAITDHLPPGLLDCLLPGPVTLVLSRGDSSILEKSLNPGLGTIGVRVPDFSFIRVIARGSGSVLALTSANLSGQPSSVCIKDFEKLWKHCAYVYDGGVLPSGRAGSTVVQLTKPGKYKILRAGSAKEETVAVLQRHSLLDDAMDT